MTWECQKDTTLENESKKKKIIKKYKTNDTFPSKETIIINTILLSKLCYVCSVFPLPKDLLSEINKIILKFLWNN